MRRRPTGCLVPAPARMAATVTHRLSPLRLDAADSWCTVSPACSCITSSGARIISDMARLAWRCVWVLSRLNAEWVEISLCSRVCRHPDSVGRRGGGNGGSATWAAGGLRCAGGAERA